jgi:hypothetical protein
VTDEAAIRQRFEPMLQEIEEHSCVTDKFVDRDVYQLYVATLWANVVLHPADAGIREADLELVHDLVNERMASVLGDGASISECFRFVNSKAGEQAMQSAKLDQTHRDLLLYFASMILDPDGHKRWMDQVRESGAEERRRKRMDYPY